MVFDFNVGVRCESIRSEMPLNQMSINCLCSDRDGQPRIRFSTSAAAAAHGLAKAGGDTTALSNDHKRPGFVRLDSVGEQKPEPAEGERVNSVCGTTAAGAGGGAHGRRHHFDEQRLTAAEMKWFGAYETDRHFLPTTSITQTRQKPFNLSKGQFESLSVMEQPAQSLPLHFMSGSHQAAAPAYWGQSPPPPPAAAWFPHQSQGSLLPLLGGHQLVPPPPSLLPRAASLPSAGGIPAGPRGGLASMVYGLCSAAVEAVVTMTSHGLNPDAKPFFPLNPHAKEFHPAAASSSAGAAAVAAADDAVDADLGSGADDDDWELIADEAADDKDGSKVGLVTAALVAAQQCSDDVNNIRNSIDLTESSSSVRQRSLSSCSDDSSLFQVEFSAAAAADSNCDSQLNADDDEDAADSNCDSQVNADDDDEDADESDESDEEDIDGEEWGNWMNAVDEVDCFRAEFKTIKPAYCYVDGRAVSDINARWNAFYGEFGSSASSASSASASAAMASASAVSGNGAVSFSSAETSSPLASASSAYRPCSSRLVRGVVSFSSAETWRVIEEDPELAEALHDARNAEKDVQRRADWDREMKRAERVLLPILEANHRQKVYKKICVDALRS